MRKYREGEKFYTLIELVDWLQQGNSVYCRGKYMHHGWVMSMQLRYLQNLVKERVICRAIKI